MLIHTIVNTETIMKLELKARITLALLRSSLFNMFLPSPFLKGKPLSWRDPLGRLLKLSLNRQEQTCL